MEDRRIYLIKPLHYWQSPRVRHLYKIKDDELDRAKKHPEGVLREDVDHVLVLQQDPKAYIEKEAEEGRVSEVFKRHIVKSGRDLKKLTDKIWTGKRQLDL